MAVEFYSIGDRSRKDFLFQLTDSDFEKLEGIMEEYRNRIGLIIDQYRSTRIHEDHVKLIIELIEKTLVNNQKPDLQLLQIKDKFKGNIRDLIAIGD